jgi:hypothetical protein
MPPWPERREPKPKTPPAPPADAPLALPALTELQNTVHDAMESLLAVAKTRKESPVPITSNNFVLTDEEKSFLEKRRAESSKGNPPPAEPTVDDLISRVDRMSHEELSRLDPKERQDMVRRLSQALAHR